jgi:transcriptional regulator with XRE-family HTH domain
MLGLTQADLAARAGISVTGLNNIERGSADPKASTLRAIQAALEFAGVEFTNGGQPGVRLKRQQDSQADLKLQINHMQGRVSFDEPTGPASPKRGMQQLRGAKSKNELVKLKNRRTRLDRREKK